MGYVQDNLMQDEEIIYIAKIHWVIYLYGILLIVGGISLSLYASSIFMIMSFFGLLSLIQAIIFKFSTELVITSKRIIAKFGLIKRETIELNHDKMESLSVNQSIIQRIFNAGTIIVNGTGGINAPIPNIDNPIKFRLNTLSTIEKYKT
jgi:uncharacterized membrane protein YdbT with pleckstrin-like domain